MKHPLLAVVDDEPGMRRLVSHFLSAAGYACQEFADGRDFLDRHDPATRCVILDLGMPVLSGIETMREMRDAGSAIPVVTMSGGVGAGEAPFLLGLGATEHLMLPFTADELLAAAARVTGDLNRLPRGSPTTYRP